MRLGLCCGPGEGPTALAMGYDYVEYPADSTESSETTNLFFPSDLRLYETYPQPNERALSLGRSLIEAAAHRGVAVMVLGSGNARRVPEGLSNVRFEIEEAFYEIAAALDAHARRLGLRVAPENLNAQETDVATSLPEMTRRLRERGVGFTVDAYHALAQEGARDADLEFWRAQILDVPTHVHFAPFDRTVPTGEEAPLHAFFARLRELGYDGRASLECRREGIPDPGPLRRLFG